jgi:D-methionine transport system ATP-binding protein
MAIIELKDVHVAFQAKKENVHAVNGVSLTVQKGDIYGIVGFSGAGKSTLVRTVNLLQQPSAGSVTVNGQVFVKDGQQVISNKKLQLARRKIGMIFQSFNLFDETTVLENVLFALKQAGLSDEDLEKRGLELLDLVGLKAKADSFPQELSGGQRQRVAIARALANEPDILISDEATSALDPENTHEILDLLAALNKKTGLTILLITHEMDAVKRIANKIAVMEKGRVIEEGPLRDVVLHPQKETTKRFVGGGQEALATLDQLELDHLDPDQEIFELVYSLDNVTKSIIIELYKQVGVSASMLYGNVELVDGEAIGTLIVSVTGSSSQREQARQFLQQTGVSVTVLERS